MSVLTLQHFVYRRLLPRCEERLPSQHTPALQVPAIPCGQVCRCEQEAQGELFFHLSLPLSTMLIVADRLLVLPYLGHKLQDQPRYLVKYVVPGQSKFRVIPSLA